MAAATHCRDLKTLSRYLGFAPQRLYILVQYHDKLYVRIKIPKRDRNAKPRDVYIPSTELKGVQRALLGRMLYEYNPHIAAYGYIKGRSAIKAAGRMSGKKYVLRVDIKDFFPSITERRIFGLFRKIGFNNKTSYILTQLTTHKGKLCLGAPTSPQLSNLICLRLDEQCTKLADTWQINYLRYSDDLFFSSAAPFNHKEFRKRIYSILRDNGFKPNRKKTRFYPSSQPRMLLGIMTHGKTLRLPRRTLRNYRAAFYKAATHLAWAKENVSRLTGMAEYYKCVYGRDTKYIEYRTVIENIRRVKLHIPYSV